MTTYGIIKYSGLGLNTQTAQDAQVIAWNATTGKLEFQEAGGGDALGTVTGDDLDLSTGNLFEITANDQSLTFSNPPSAHNFKIKLTGAGTVSAYILSAASYDSVSFSVFGQAATPQGLAFNNDGTKMYVVGTSSDSVHQYTLSTAFDISTASYDNISFSVAAQDTIPLGLAFNNDGTKMYIVGAASDSVHQYTLSTAFDLSTASYDIVSFSVSGQETSPRELAFNNDGTKMYMVGSGSSGSVHQYTLSTAFDLSTASYDSVSFSVLGQESVPQGLAFNNDGTKMYIVGSTSDSVHQYTLSTAFDVGTASYDIVSFSVSGQETNPTGLAFNNDGTKMYVVGQTSDTVFEYLTSANTLATVTYPESVKFTDSTPPEIAAIGKEDIIEFVTFNGGTSYNAYQLGDNQ